MSARVQGFHIKLLKDGIAAPHDALDGDKPVVRYPLRTGTPFQGELFIAPPKETQPPWLQFVQSGVESPIEELKNSSNAAVLVVRGAERFFAVLFGHGRHLLDNKKVVSDFGLRTALNGLHHDQLRSVNKFTLDDDPVHSDVQMTRDSGINSFGLDISRDVLRGVTGVPLPSTLVRSMSGRESTLALSVAITFGELPDLCNRMLALYRKRTYAKHFKWVDQIRRVSDPMLVQNLDQQLVAELARGVGKSRVRFAPPRVLNWETVHGFTFGADRSQASPSLEPDGYLRSFGVDAPTVERVTKDRVLVYEGNELQPTESWSVRDAMLFEVTHKGRRYILSAGDWFEVDASFVAKTRHEGSLIERSGISLPPVIATNGKLENEGDYNIRAAGGGRLFALMDRKLARCFAAPDLIEPCDLLSRNRELIHVKHRKGGSSTLSHLFAQARVASEGLLGDESFRRDFRGHLSKQWRSLITENRPVADDFEVVLAMLDCDPRDPFSDLPFFSQVNLVRTVADIRSRGLRVSILGVPRA